MKKCPFYAGECGAKACTLWTQCGSAYEQLKDACDFVAWVRKRMAESATRLVAAEA